MSVSWSSCWQCPHACVPHAYDVKYLQVACVVYEPGCCPADSSATLETHTCTARQLKQGPARNISLTAQSPLLTGVVNINQQGLCQSNPVDTNVQLLNYSQVNLDDTSAPFLNWTQLQDSKHQSLPSKVLAAMSNSLAVPSQVHMCTHS
jgi:hypothetical protein